MAIFPPKHLLLRTEPTPEEVPLQHLFVALHSTSLILLTSLTLIILVAKLKRHPVLFSVSSLRASSLKSSTTDLSLPSFSQLFAAFSLNDIFNLLLCVVIFHLFPSKNRSLPSSLPFPPLRLFHSLLSLSSRHQLPSTFICELGTLPDLTGRNDSWDGNRDDERDVLGRPDLVAADGASWEEATLRSVPQPTGEYLCSIPPSLCSCTRALLSDEPRRERVSRPSSTAH